MRKKRRLSKKNIHFTFLDYIYFVGEFSNLRWMNGPRLLSTPFFFPSILLFVWLCDDTKTFFPILLGLILYFGICFFIYRFYQRNNREEFVVRHFMISSWANRAIANLIAILWSVLSLFLPLIPLMKWIGLSL